MCYYFSKQKFLNSLVWLDHSDSEAFKYCSKVLTQEGGISTMNAQCTTLTPVMKIIGNVRSVQIHTSPPSPFSTSPSFLCVCAAIQVGSKRWHQGKKGTVINYHHIHIQFPITYILRMVLRTFGYWWLAVGLVLAWVMSGRGTTLHIVYIWAPLLTGTVSNTSVMMLSTEEYTYMFK